jgi:hypothetical protein
MILPSGSRQMKVRVKRVEGKDARTVEITGDFIQLDAF